VLARPLLTLYQAGAQLMAGYPLEDVKTLLNEGTDEDIQTPSGAIAAILALIASFQGDTQLSRVYSRQALEELPQESQFMRSLAAQNLGFAFAAVGDLEQAIRSLRQAAQIAQQAGSPLIRVISLAHIAELQVAQGQLKMAQATYEQALNIASDKVGKRLPIAGMPLIGLGEIKREQNQLDQAYQLVEEGLHRTEQWSLVSTIDGHLTLARIYEAQDKPKQTDAEMQAAQERSLEFDATEMDDLMVAYHQARIWINRGQADTAAEWLRTQEARVFSQQGGNGKADHFFIELLRLATHSRLALASGQTEKALALLKTHQEQAKQHGVKRSVMEGSILQTLALDAQGDDQGSMNALQEALHLGESEGFIRLFVEEGSPLAHLLYKAAEQGISPEYAGQLLAAFPTDQHTELDSASNLVEPLSERETEILTLIAQGLTNREIANRLVISLRTVKWHASNIYSKLAVKNRTEAVAQARKLGILAS
jgi:LuxR family maltose regulon positive regulatory protein